MTDTFATTTTANCALPSGAISLIRRLIDQARNRISLLSALETNGQIDSLATRHQAEMLKHDAESIMSLLADLPHIHRSQP